MVTGNSDDLVPGTLKKSIKSLIMKKAISVDLKLRKSPNLYLLPSDCSSFILF